MKISKQQQCIDHIVKHCEPTPKGTFAYIDIFDTVGEMYDLDYSEDEAKIQHLCEQVDTMLPTMPPGTRNV